MKDKKKVYVDMDGVLAKWNVKATMEDVGTPGYFIKLEPVWNMVSAIRTMIKNEYEICILSSVLGKWAEEEKKKWLSIYIPELNPDHIIFVPDGTSKSSFLAQNNFINTKDILLDDFSKNLLEWHGIGIKILNGINGTKGTWKGYTVSANSSPDVIVKTIALFSN